MTGSHVTTDTGCDRWLLVFGLSSLLSARPIQTTRCVRAVEQVSQCHDSRYITNRCK